MPLYTSVLKSCIFEYEGRDYFQTILQKTELFFNQNAYFACPTVTIFALDRYSSELRKMELMRPQLLRFKHPRLMALGYTRECPLRVFTFPTLEGLHHEIELFLKRTLETSESFGGGYSDTIFYSPRPEFREYLQTKYTNMGVYSLPKDGVELTEFTLAEEKKVSNYLRWARPKNLRTLYGAVLHYLIVGNYTTRYTTGNLALKTLKLIQEMVKTKRLVIKRREDSFEEEWEEWEIPKMIEELNKSLRRKRKENDNEKEGEEENEDPFFDSSKIPTLRIKVKAEGEKEEKENKPRGKCPLSLVIWCRKYCAKYQIKNFY